MSMKSESSDRVGDQQEIESASNHQIDTGRDVEKAQEPPTRDHEQHDLPFANFPQEVLFVLTAMCGQIFTQAGLALANSNLVDIGEHFHDSGIPKRSWYVAAYSLTVGTFILTAGRLGDMFGHKRLLLIGWAWYSLWSLVSGVSSYVSTSTFFIACRAIQGIGPAILMPNSMAAIGRSYPEGKRRHMVFALFGACAPGGYVLGSVFSTLLAKFLSWPWGFYIMTIACAVLGVVACYAIPQDGPMNLSTQKFDYWGGITGVTGLILFNIAWNQAPIVGWEQPYVYVLLILGVLFFAAFVVIELKVAEQPLVPDFSPTVALVLGIVACGWAVFGIWIFNVWQFVEQLRHIPPLLLTAHLCPVCIVGFSAAVLTGWLVGRVPTSFIMLMALVIFTTTSIICATMPVDQIYWAQEFVVFVIAPIGMEFSFPAATILLSGAVSREHQGIAASLVATVVNYSISIGLGISGTVQAYTYPGEDTDSLFHSFRVAFYTGIGIGGLGITLAAVTLFKETIYDKRGGFVTKPR